MNSRQKTPPGHKPGGWGRMEMGCSASVCLSAPIAARGMLHHDSESHRWVSNSTSFSTPTAPLCRLAVTWLRVSAAPMRPACRLLPSPGEPYPPTMIGGLLATRPPVRKDPVGRVAPNGQRPTDKPAKALRRGSAGTFRVARRTCADPHHRVGYGCHLDSPPLRTGYTRLISTAQPRWARLCTSSSLYRLLSLARIRSLNTAPSAHEATQRRAGYDRA